MLRFLPRPLLLLAVLLLTAAQPLYSQAPAWQDATCPGGGGGESTAVDAAGNTYVTGSFRGTATFGATTLTSAGGDDIFVAKRTPAGAWQWATSTGSSGIDDATGVAVDGSGGVIVVGVFSSPALAFGATTLTNAGRSDLFVAKLTPTGAWQWASRAGGNSDDYGTDVAVDGNGGVVVTGHFQSLTIAFDATTLTNTDPSGGSTDLFVAKLTPTGVWQWVKRAQGSASDFSYGVAVDSSNGVIVTGSYGSSPLSFGAITLTGGGGLDLFVAKLTSTGVWQWATRARGNDDDESRGVAVDSSGGVVVTGYFQSPTLSFGSTTLTRADPSGRASDLFVAKLTPTGAWQWASRAGGNGSDYSNSVAVDGSGSVIITGSFLSSTITFGPTTLTNVGGRNPLVAKLAPTGAWQWATGAGGSGINESNGVMVDGSGGVVVTGYFQSPTISFGATTLTNPNPGYDAIFLARLSSVTGLLDEAGTTGLSLWPNPAHGTVRLTLEAPAAGGLQVRVLNALGQLVWQEQAAVGGGQVIRSLPAGQWRAGVYHVQVRCGEQLTTQQLVVQP